MESSRGVLLSVHNGIYNDFVYGKPITYSWVHFPFF